ncbi:plasmid partition family protein [Borreliella burgdorferi]|nr:plasmid partition family protein [Borreliella burgdorferi]
MRPLRFQLKTEDAYIYYKSKSRFTSFLLEKLLKDIFLTQNYLY